MHYNPTFTQLIFDVDVIGKKKREGKREEGKKKKYQNKEIKKSKNQKRKKKITK
jgi:hypothetical protein